MSEVFTLGDQSRLVVYSAIALNQTLGRKTRSDTEAIAKLLDTDDILDLSLGMRPDEYLERMETAKHTFRKNGILGLTNKGYRAYQKLLEMQKGYEQRRGKTAA